MLSSVNHTYVMYYGWKFPASSRFPLSGIFCPNQPWITSQAVFESLKMGFV